MLITRSKVLSGNNLSEFLLSKIVWSYVYFTLCSGVNSINLIIIQLLYTHFEKPIAVEIGMWLERRPLLQQVFSRLYLRSGYRSSGSHDAGPTVRVALLQFLGAFLQVGRRPSFGHDPPFEHPIRWHGTVGIYIYI